MIKKWINKYKTFPVQVRASFWFLICAFLQKGISVITTPIFTRLLSTVEYGQYSVFNSWLSIVTVFITFNLYNGVYTRGLVKYEEDKKRYSSALQGLCTTLILVWLVIYLLFRVFWNQLFELTTVQMLAMFLMIWATAAFNFWSVEQRVDFKYRTLVIVTLAVSVVNPVIGIVFVVLAEDKVTARILGLALVELIAYTGFFMVQMKRGRKIYVKEYWKHALLFNLPLIPHYLSQTVLNSSDRIMISKMVSADAAGIYSLAYSISQIMSIFNTALIKTVEPWLYKIIKAGRLQEIGKIASPIFVLIGVVNLALIALAPEAVTIFAPGEYHEAIWIIPPIAMSVYFMFSYTFFAVFEFYYEKTGYITFATLAGAVLNIVLNFIFIQIFGYMAAAYTTLVCYMVYSIAHYSFMRKLCIEHLDNVKIYNVRTLLTITSAFMMLGFIFLFTYSNEWLRYGLIIACCASLIVMRRRVIQMVKRVVNIKKEK